MDLNDLSAARNMALGMAEASAKEFHAAEVEWYGAWLDATNQPSPERTQRAEAARQTALKARRAFKLDQLELKSLGLGGAGSDIITKTVAKIHRDGHELDMREVHEGREVPVLRVHLAPEEAG